MVRYPPRVALLLVAHTFVLCGFTRTVHAACLSTTPLACGETKNGLLSTADEVDCFQFTVADGEAVSITTQVTAGVFQPCWRIEGTPDATCGEGERLLATAGTFFALGQAFRTAPIPAITPTQPIENLGFKTILPDPQKTPWLVAGDGKSPLFGLFSVFRANVPQLHVEHDPQACMMRGVSMKVDEARDVLLGA